MIYAKPEKKKVHWTYLAVQGQAVGGGRIHMELLRILNITKSLYNRLFK